ncbi:MAG TPA: type II secretion system protein GspG [Terriglobia bacterium]|nr:type II secretion system protein GspG [Terriglobia bacterium]
MTREKGFTLIELAVVLAIIAVLAAILTPLVSNYLDQARVTRAQADVRTMADAVKLYQRDTGRYPIYDSSAGYPNTVGDGTRNIFGTSSGSAPTQGAVNWNLGAVLATTTLDAYLNNNYSGPSGNAPFPKAAFRGPYLGSVDSDPWGNKYLLTAVNLAPNNSNHAFVLSAGPDGRTDTALTQGTGAPLVTGGDDVVSVIK